jgi:uncharacterized membrane protein
MLNVDIRDEFSEFGKKMKIVGIMIILSIIPYIGTILSLIGSIFAIMALSDIRDANYKLKQSSLENYHSKYSTAIVFRIIGMVISGAGSFYSLGKPFFFSIWTIIPTIISFIISIIAAAIEMDAWRSLTDFFNQNRSLFPTHIALEASEGSDKLRTAALMNVLSFLIITILIGWILQIVGYFKLAKLEEIIRYTETTPTTPVPSTQQTSLATPTPSNNIFCSNCGAKITGEGKFCGECGSSLTQS